MIAYLKGLADFTQLEIEPHIYEADAPGYGLLTGSSLETEVDPQGIARSKAELII